MIKMEDIYWYMITHIIGLELMKDVKTTKPINTIFIGSWVLYNIAIEN